MKVTEQAWAEQVEAVDRAEMRADELALAVEVVLRNHDDCLCRHARRILQEAFDATKTEKEES